MAENSSATVAPSNKQKFWEFHINNWRQRKISQTAYCREHGLILHRFSYWKRAMGLKDSTISFVSVQLCSNLPVTCKASNLNLFTANGYRIEIAIGFDPALLKQLLSAVQSL